MIQLEFFKDVWADGYITLDKINVTCNYFQNLENIPQPKDFPQNIISSSTDKFVGRGRELEHLSQQLQRHNEVVIAAVEGMGGVGKTELAIQYSLLHLQLHTYPGGICWLRAREQDIGLQIVNFARTDLGLQPPDDLELPDRVRWCWKRWLEGNTLIVLDDVKNYSDIKPYLPPQPSQFKVLITTRLKLDLPSSLYLEVLSEPDALELLKQLVGSEKVEQELETAKDLCQRLGYLPLALQLVGRYVKKRRISLTEELERLEGKGLGHPSMDVPENDPTWTLDIKRGVEAAFELSWEELKKFKFVQELGCLLSLFALAPIPWSLVESAAVEQDPEELEDARVELESLHLLQGENSYQLHQLIQEFLRNKQNKLANADKQKYNFCTAIVEVADKIPQTPTLSEITSLIPFIPHLAEAVTVYQNWLRDEDLISPFVGLGHFYEGQGAYPQALPWLKQCVSVARERLGEEHPHVATSLINLAVLYYKQGWYEEAEPLYVEALETRKWMLGEKHLDVALCENNLAVLYYKQGWYEEAESLMVEALETRKWLAEGSLDVANSMSSLAELYYEQGRYEEAEPLYVEALEMTRGMLGEEHPYVATSLNNLAVLYHEQGRYEEAELLYLEALEMRKRMFGQEHPDVANSLNNLAGLYDRQGRYEEAESLYLEALEMTKKIRGEEHPHVATSRNNLVGLYDRQGRYEEAESLMVEALEIKKRLLGQDHPDVADSMNNLALLYCSQGRYSEAEPLYVGIFEMMRRIVGEGEEHLAVAQSMNNLAKIYDAEGRYEKAEPLCLEALEMYKRILGEEHPDVAQSMNNLAKIYESQSRYEEAEPLFLQALTIAERVLGKNHPNTNTIRKNYEQLKER